MDNVVVFEHPLIQHKISLLRDKNTGTNEFRQLVDEIAMLEGFEALSDLPVEDVEIETPIEKCMTPMIAGRKLAVVPILRAGLGDASDDELAAEYSHCLFDADAFGHSA